MDTKDYIFISPHLDDVTLSCGGLVWDLVRQGHRVEIWTLMSGLQSDETYSNFAQSLHKNWDIPDREAILVRRAEDQAACAVLGAHCRHFGWLDAIYRSDPQSGAPIVNNNEELFSRLPEQTLVDEIAAVLSTSLPKDVLLVLPMGLGNHVDHQVIVWVGRQLGRTDFWYADYPYVIHHFDNPLITDGTLEILPHALSEAALLAWQEAVLCYVSQLTTFWRDTEETQLALRNYLAGGGGRLWRKRRLDSPKA
jgi:hypothetical protein